MKCRPQSVGGGGSRWRCGCQRWCETAAAKPTGASAKKLAGVHQLAADKPKASESATANSRGSANLTRADLGGEESQGTLLNRGVLWLTSRMIPCSASPPVVVASWRRCRVRHEYESSNPAAVSANVDALERGTGFMLWSGFACPACRAGQSVRRRRKRLRRRRLLVALESGEVAARYRSKRVRMLLRTLGRVTRFRSR